jgi:hypothetical protein
MGVFGVSKERKAESRPERDSRAFICVAASGVRIRNALCWSSQRRPLALANTSAELAGASPAASVIDVAFSSSYRDGLRLVVEHISPPEVLEVAALLTEGLRSGM